MTEDFAELLRLLDEMQKLMVRIESQFSICNEADDRRRLRKRGALTHDEVVESLRADGIVMTRQAVWSAEMRALKKLRRTMNKKLNDKGLP